MTVIEIVKSYLLKHGYQGLYYPGACSCMIDDLMPCSSFSGTCIPVLYITDCPMDESCYCGGFHISNNLEVTDKEPHDA